MVAQGSFPALGEHQLLLLFAQLFVLLVTVRAVGGLAKRANLPSVLGELLAGIGLASVLPGESLAANDQRFIFSLFIGTAFSISAIPGIATVLIDMDAMLKQDIWNPVRAQMSGLQFSTARTHQMQPRPVVNY